MTNLENAKEMFADARKHCPGMQRDFYRLTWLMSEKMLDNPNPTEVLIASVIAHDMLADDSVFSADDLPELTRIRKKQVWNQSKWIPYFVSKIADEEFSEEFKALWRQKYNYDGPMPVRVSDVPIAVDDCPDYVKAAANWWANEVLAPSCIGRTILTDIMDYVMDHPEREYTYDEIISFKDVLAIGIMNELKERYECELYVTSIPCDILRAAGMAICIDVLDFPKRCSMTINPNKVTVVKGHGFTPKVVWEKKD